MNDPSTLQPYRWAMLFGVWLVYTCFGMAVYSTAPLVEPIASELGLSLSAMGTIMGAWPLVYIGMAIPAGALLDRIGVRPGLLIATVIITLSVALRSAATGYLMLFLAVAMFGVGGPLVSVGAPKLIASWFDGRERGLAIGIYSTGPTIGAVSALSLTNSVIMPATGYQWRATLLVFAGMTTLAGVVWFFISSHPAGRLHDPKDVASGTLKTQFQIFTRLLRVPTVRVVLLLAVGVFIFNHALNNWLPEILRTGGMNAAQAGFWASIPSLVGTAAALTLPRFATGRCRMPLLFVIVLLAATATLLIAYAGGAVLGLGLIFQGIARGAMIPLAMLVLIETREVDARVMGAAGGLFYTAAEIGGVIGPTVTGILADLTGGFLAPLMTLTAVCLICSVLVLTLNYIQRNAEYEPARDSVS
jgi:cyanate permease